MKPIFQTKFGAPGGNCFAACIASVFELDSAEDVPNFCYDTPDGKDWMEAASNWCRERFGFGLFTVRAPEGADYDEQARYMRNFFARSHAYMICGVKTTRGVLHAVIFRDGKLVHDPYPGGSAIVGRVVDFTVFFPIDPVAARASTTFACPQMVPDNPSQRHSADVSA